MRPETRPIPVPEIAAIDIENGLDGKTNLVGVIEPSGSYHAFSNEAGALDFLVSRKVDGECCFAHNGSGFDFQRMLPAMVASQIPFTWALQGGKLISGILGDRKHGLRFADSALLYRSSLRKLGEDLGLHKGETWEVEGQALQDYNERDCEIVVQGMRLLANVGAKFGFALRPTPAACALDYIRRHLEKPLYLPISEAFAPGYFGGRVLLLQPEAGAGFCVDVNSLYPWAMAQRLPYDEPTTYPGPFTQAEARRLFRDSIGFASCRVKIAPVAVPPLPVRGKNRTIYPVGTFDGLWTFADLASLGANDKVWIRRCWVFPKACAFLRETIEDLYARRKTTTNVAEKAAIKILLNSTYGKFAEHCEKTSLTSEETSDACPVVNEAGVWFLYKEHKTTRPAARSPAVASYITALARQRWHALFNQYQHKTIYLDTDSAYLLGTPEEYPDLPIDDGLGNLKIESRFTEFRGLAPKVYGYRKISGDCEIRAKGMPMGGSFERIGNELRTERPGKLPCCYAKHGLDFLRGLAEGCIVAASRPVSFALAGANAPGSWVTIKRELRAGPDSGRTWAAGMVRTAAPVWERDETTCFTGKPYTDEETEED